MQMFNPPHPGKVLREYLGTVTVTSAAQHLGVTRASLSGPECRRNTTSGKHRRSGARSWPRWWLSTRNSLGQPNIRPSFSGIVDLALEFAFDLAFAVSAV